MDRLPLFDEVSTGEAAAVLVNPDQTADKEVAPAKVAQLLVHRNTHMKALLCKAFFLLIEASIGFFDRLEGRPTAQFMDHIPLGSGHHETISNRAASLGNNGFQVDGAVSHDADTALLYNLVVEKKVVLPRIPGTAGHPAQYRREGIFLLEEAEKGVCRCREGFRQNNKKWGIFIQGGWIGPSLYLDTLGIFLKGEVKREEGDIGQTCDPE